MLFDLRTAAPDSAVVDRLHGIGVKTAEITDDHGSSALIAAAHRLTVRPGRCVVVADSAASVEAARDGGFALMVGLDRLGGELTEADDVIGDVGEISVRTGDLRMSELPDALQAFALGDRHPAVFFDFDGTLSDIVDDPDTARLTAGAAEALQLLTTQCPVAVLSGRDLADVRERIGLPGLWYAGSHGFELTGPDDSHHQNDAAAASLPVLDEAAAELRDQLGGVTGVALEHKRFGVSVHYRNAARDRVGEVTSAVRSAGKRHGLRVTTGREVIELRPNVDWDKGKTLRWVLDQIRDTGAGPLWPIYLGDDITDEDAFDAVHDDGVGIVIRHSDDGDRATSSLFALDSPEQVSEFTDRLARQLRGKR